MWIFNKEQTKIINTDVVHTISIRDHSITNFEGMILKLVYELYADRDLIEVFETKEGRTEKIELLCL